MKWLLMVAYATFVLSMSQGCKPSDDAADDTEHDHDHAEGETHDHDHAEGEDHDHAEDDATGEAHDHEGEGEEHAHAHSLEDAIDMGTQTVGAWTVHGLQMGTLDSAAHAGTYWFTIEGEPEPEAVRVVLKSASGAESMKAKALKLESGYYDADLSELPADAGAGSVVMVEIDPPADGETMIVEFEVPASTG